MFFLAGEIDPLDPQTTNIASIIQKFIPGVFHMKKTSDILFMGVEKIREFIW